MNIVRTDKVVLTITAAEIVAMLRGATNRLEIWGLPSDGKGVDLKAGPAGLEVTYYAAGRRMLPAPIIPITDGEPPTGGTPAAMVA